MKISVLGAGAFGTALAISLAREAPVTLWARDSATMARDRVNTRRLPDAHFPDALILTGSLADAASADIILVAVPMQTLRSFLKKHASLLSEKVLVACCKGIELETGLGPISIIAQEIPTAVPAILTGPSFAVDIAVGLPTALTLACTDDAICGQVQNELTTANLRLYRTTDTVGAELGGALKNVIAIACGAAIGAGLGESARAALMTRGFTEIQRLAVTQNARATTLAGLSGFGDLTLTCTSDKSRNYRLGLSLGQGRTFGPDTTVEGAATASAVNNIAQATNLDLPITAAVAALLENRINVSQAMHSLLTRPLKEE